MEITKEEKYFGFKEIIFKFDCFGNARIVFPNDDVKTDKWLLKAEYFDAFPEAEIELVKQGYHICYLDNISRWGEDKDCERKFAFRNFLMKEFGLNPKCVPVGMSCGGCHAINLASRHPDIIAAMYLDSPVCNYLSCPMSFGDSTYADARQEFFDATGMTRSELICYREHPFDRAPVLVKNRLPIIMLYGDVDMTLPYYENGKLIEDYYKAHGCEDIIEVHRKHGYAHHPHGFVGDNSPIVDFIKKYY